jgi:hypothetical protein
LTLEEARAWLDAHNRAIDGYRERDYKVWVDITALAPLGADAAEIVEQGKRYSSSRPNFRGSAVLVSSATVAMQHRRTSMSGGVIDTELISDDPDALRAHLRVVDRRPG